MTAAHAFQPLDETPNEPEHWSAESLCAQIGPEMFFPEKGGSTKDAKQICAACPVRQLCLDYALENNERHGVWGGLSERERQRLMASRNRAQRPE